MSFILPSLQAPTFRVTTFRVTSVFLSAIVIVPVWPMFFFNLFKAHFYEVTAVPV